MIYWKLISCAIDFKCQQCGIRFTGHQLDSCGYHLSEESVDIEPTKKYSKCCQQTENRFETQLLSKSYCRFKTHKLYESSSPRKGV